MQITLYKTKNPINSINKVLTDSKSFNIKIKERANIVKPVIQIRSDEIITHNYAYIPSLKRYYFVDNIEVFPDNIYQLYLNCDVLESFKTDILASKATVIKDNTGNKYIDNGYVKEVKKDVEYIDFLHNFLDVSSPKYVLVTSKVSHT